MKTKALTKEKINLITLGCSKNLVDSEIILTQLKSNGLNIKHEDSSEADIVIINTCGFIDRAKEESVNTILSYANEKEEGNIKKLYVTGCLSERYKDDLKKEIPEVDAWFGTMDLPGLLRKFEVDYKDELVGERLTTTASHYAYLKISEGCDRPCSFCAIPLMRGKHRSRPIEKLVEEAKWLASRGVKEILLIAQDSTYYGLDLYKERALNKLLLELSKVEGIEWIRLHYAYPSGFPVEILDTIREQDRIANYLDIPLQHVSDKLLKSMRRGTTLEKTRSLMGEIREKVPGITLRTTMIVGYPGETEEDFEDLKNFVLETRFDRLGVFTYSHEENTHAHSLDDDIPDEIKESRRAELMEIQQEISESLNGEKVGKELRVIIDRKEGEYWIGRTEADSPEVDNEVLIHDEGHQLKIGEIYNCKVVGAEAFDLFAEPIHA